MPSFNDRTGETRKMRNGLTATIAKYRNAKNIDVMFENGLMVERNQYDNFMRGGIACPLLVEQQPDGHLKITNLNTNPHSVFRIDAEDLHIIQVCFWSESDNGYIRNPAKGKLHKLIMSAPKGFDIDHINGDKSDNRKKNLRVCTRSENLCNKRIRKNNSSGFKGVSWCSSRGRWEAHISVNRKGSFLGYFDTAKEAANAYNAAAIKLHGEFARLNDI